MNYTPPESVSNSRDQLCARSENAHVNRGCSYTGPSPEVLLMNTTRDIPDLQRLHAEMTVDNLRLWECLNAVRCDRRVRGIDVLYELFSLTDREFFRCYPVYSSLEESGSGALHHLEASCGRHSERYLQHLVMHTNRMILENSRLYACIDLLSSDSSHIPDEVVCHIFALSEEEFSKRYPSIGVGNRICRHLANLHEETKGWRYRPISTTFRSPRRFFPTFMGSSMSSLPSGPSCSNTSSRDFNASSAKCPGEALSLRGLASSRRSWPSALESVAKEDRLEHNRRHQNADQLGEAPPSPRCPVPQDFSFATRSQWSNTKPPSPQRHSSMSSERTFDYPRLVSQDLARQPAEARTLLRGRSLSLEGRSHAKSNNAVVHDDAGVGLNVYRKDTMRFHDHDGADDSDDYDDGIAYKRKNRRVLSLSSSMSSLSRSRDFGTRPLPSNRRFDDPKLDRDSKPSRDPTFEPYRSVAGQDIAPGWSSRNTPSHARRQEQEMSARASGFERNHQRSATAPNANTPRKDSLLVRERRDRSTPSRWREDAAYRRHARNRTSASEVQTRRLSDAGCKLGENDAWDEGVSSFYPEVPGYKLNASDTRGKNSSLQQRKKKSSRSEKSSLSLLQPLVIRHDFSPAAAEDRRRLPTTNDLARGSAGAKNSPPGSSDNEGAGSGLSPQGVEESRQQLMELRSVLRQHSSFAPKRDYLSRRLPSDCFRFDDQGHLDLERLATSYDASSRLKSRIARCPDERPSPTSQSRSKRGAAEKSSLSMPRISKSSSETSVKGRHGPAYSKGTSGGQEVAGRKPNDRLDSERSGHLASAESEAGNRLAMNNNAYGKPFEGSCLSSEKSGWSSLSSSGNTRSKWHDKDCTKVAEDADKRSGESPPTSAATAPTLVNSLPRAVSDLRVEIDKTRSFREKRVPKNENSLQSLYENLGETPAQPAKHSFAENKSRASTDSTRRHLDFEEEQCGTPLLNSSQNQSADDFSTGLGTPKQWLETSPSKLQYENDRDAGSTCTPACILGEVAFQLERRIIQMVFGEESSNHAPRLVMDQDDPKSYTCQRHRFYGYTVSNMPEKIRAECRRQNSGPRDGVREADLKFKLRGIMAELRGLGYSMNKHSSMAQDVINKYGLFSQPPDDATIAKLGLHDFRCVRDHVLMLAEPEEREDLLVLLNCLHALGRKIGKPVLSFD